MRRGEPRDVEETSAPALSTPPGRLAAVDALRGFALLGILVVNITYYASGYRMAGLATPWFTSLLDWEVRAVVAVLFENKFYLLFAFLFGYSFTLQVDSAQRAGASFVPRFLRRLAGLFLLGMAHAIFLFPGDILATYAMVGLALLVLRGLTPRAAMILAVALTAALAAGMLLLAGLAMAGGGDAFGAVAESAAQAEQADRALHGSAGMIISEHVHKLGRIFLLRVFVQCPTVLAACLVGLAVGNRRLLCDDPSEHLAVLRRLQWAGFTVGLAGAGVYAHATWSGGGGAYHMLGQSVNLVTSPLLAAAYAATLLRVLPAVPRLAALFAPPGRMALTNYLAQSLICSLIFTGYGLSLVETLSPLPVVSIGFLLFAAQAAYSRLWLARYRYGPVEWWLRWLTNGRRPAFVRPPRHTALPGVRRRRARST
ncbi:uncharacterized protein FHS43_002418 [Streptosporangium becharense]|uniref:DUF418 domain-containing protein n=1 Tax=Streptosporangium becharense TaxID=1816182 RepID=A0A7W9MIT6_9ACTN|nr:DUF418 domain-containing protein [Streptosporangium becharense]MBB2911153.1 uncharacterized protein [Streptosporangium becharense]MBB5821789.1 uncharacterized protein [Streptosporangium becharense]